MNLDEGTTAEKQRRRWVAPVAAGSVIAVIVLIGAGLMAGGTPAPEPAPTPTTTATPTATPDDHGHDHATVEAAPAQAWSTLVAFLDAWRTVDVQARAAGLTQTATPRLAEGLVATSPAKTVTAPVTSITADSVTPYAADFHVHLAGEDPIRVVAIIEPGARQGWLVDHIAPLEED